MRRGSVLLFSLIVMAITVIATGALTSYYVNAANVAKFYNERRSSCRVGATRAVRKSLDKVMAKIAELAQQAQSTPEVGLNIQGKTMDEVFEEVKAVVDKVTAKELLIDDQQFSLVTEHVEEHVIRITANYYDKTTGKTVEVVSASIEFENTSTRNTLPVFDYVYFADNNGQLNSSYIIANGDVGSNGNFALNGATVNGYVDYLDTLTVSGNPRAWLQGAYMAKIVAEFKVSDSAQKVVEQVRPTNPTLYEENGETKTVDWEGGYEPVYATNPYSWNETRPDPLDDPTNDKPNEPPKVERAVTSSKNQPSSSSSDWREIDIDD